MKGVVLAGGLGRRFDPVTRVVNKHLLDVFDQPMIYFPIRTLVKAGITDVTVVTGKEINQFRELLGDGHELGAEIRYAVQDGELGISHALLQTEELVAGGRVVVILGDNIYQTDISAFVRRYEEQQTGAFVLLKEVGTEDAKRFAVAEVVEGKVVDIVEKPQEPKSDLVVTGCYMFDDRVFDFIRTLRPSERNEYEVTDLLNIYVREGTLHHDVLAGWWTDAGTPPSKLKASILVALQKGVTFHR
ncbi:MAG TPA: sugar phosphate nucleotidyltransferase [Actinomycetota bacterium]|nr:sugar phosphate nucleotidyltransferase [Actinomycetota bacterium]